MAKKDRWFIPTNTENLKLIIAQGLITTSDGFEKYYKDTLELYKDEMEIPLYKNSIPQAVLDLVISEDEGLIHCLIEIDAGSVLEGRSLDATKSQNCFLIRAPLPISCIAKVIFKSPDEKNKFENEVKSFSNVVCIGLKLQSNKIDSKLFLTNDLSFENKEEPLSDVAGSTSRGEQKKLDYQKIYAFGGVLTNLFYFSKNGACSDQWFRYFSDFTVGADKPNNTELGIVFNYFFSGREEGSVQFKIKQNMYEAVINIAISNKDFKNKILEYLEGDSWGEDKKSQKRTREIAKKLRDIEAATGDPVSEYLNNNESPLEKILILLFLCEDSDALIDYENKNVSFNEEEYLLLALMFGIRNKFSKSPSFLREYTDLQQFVSYKMAEYAHKIMRSDVTFRGQKMGGTIYQQCFANNHAMLNEKLVKALQLDNFVRTIMPAKEFSHNNGKNFYSGFCNPKHDIDKEEYFEHMSKFKITQDIYNKIFKG